MLTDGQILDLWRRLWNSASDEIDEKGRRRHVDGIKWLLKKYGVAVTSGAGPHAAPRRDALARLEKLGAIERIGGGENSRTRALWVARPSRDGTD